MTKPRGKKQTDAAIAARVLKSKGLIPKTWDLRRPLTAGQKSYLTKQSAKYAQIIRRPQDFQMRKVGKASIPHLRKIGFETKGDRVIIPKKGQRINIKGNKVIIRESRWRSEVVLAPGPDILDRAEAHIESGDAPLPKGTYWAIRLGNDFHAVTTNTFHPTLRALLDANAKGSGSLTRIDIAKYASIVKVTQTDDYFGDEDMEGDSESNL